MAVTHLRKVGIKVKSDDWVWKEPFKKTEWLNSKDGQWLTSQCKKTKQKIKSLELKVTQKPDINIVWVTNNVSTYLKAVKWEKRRLTTLIAAIKQKPSNRNLQWDQKQDCSGIESGASTPQPAGPLLLKKHIDHVFCVFLHIILYISKLSLGAARKLESSMLEYGDFL